MQYKIRNQANESDAVEFYLSIDSYGSVSLEAEDAEGENWIILSFEPGGPVRLESGVNNSVGLELDKSGYVKTIKV